MIALDQYWDGPFKFIQGWVEHGLLLPLKAVAEFQAVSGITGPVLEIGVHHGRFLLALATLTAANEAVVAVDVFGQQDLNLDGSGCGDRKAFEHHAISVIGDARKLIVIQQDSLCFGPLLRQRLLEECGPFRFISIDGGHTPEHTYSDLQLSADLMTGPGVITVDDYYNMHWPGVHEGTCRFMTNHPAKIKPFCYTHNKLFFSGYSHVDRYRDAFHQQFHTHPQYKVTTMWGSPVVVFA